MQWWLPSDVLRLILHQVDRAHLRPLRLLSTEWVRHVQEAIADHPACTTLTIRSSTVAMPCVIAMGRVYGIGCRKLSLPHWFPWERLCALAPYLPNLMELEGNEICIDALQLTAVCRQFPRLRRLGLSYSRSVDGRRDLSHVVPLSVYRELAAVCPYLEEVAINHRPGPHQPQARMHASQVLEWGRHFPNLQQLPNLSSECLLRGESAQMELLATLAACPSITALDMDSNIPAFEEVIGACRFLRRLKIEDVPLALYGARLGDVLQRAPLLAYLDLSGAYLDESTVVGVLTRCVQVEVLKLSCSNDSEGFNDLELDAGSLTTTAIGAAAAMPRLQTFGFVFVFEFEMDMYLTSMLDILQSSRSLTGLSLEYSRLPAAAGESVLRFLEACPQIRFVNINDVSISVSDDDEEDERFEDTPEWGRIEEVLNSRGGSGGVGILPTGTALRQ